MSVKHTEFKFGKYYFKSLFWFIIGSILAAFAIDVILVPNQLIDGGVVGLAMMGGFLLGEQYLPFLLVLFNLPFAFLAYKQIGKHFVIQMVTAVIVFAICLVLFHWIPQAFNTEPIKFEGDPLEVVVLGGFVLGLGVGLIIRNGGSTDGTEIMGIIINRKQGYTVGQVILFTNFFIFALSGIVYQNWHTALLSMLTYVIATKVMDMVIVGLEDTKSVTIIAANPQHLAEVLMNKLGVGVTVMYGRGAYSGAAREILYIVVERLQLAELKEIVQTEDPRAFLAVENLHEVINGRHNPHGANHAHSK